MKYSASLIALASFLINAPFSASAEVTSPKVYELFTSQGCSSCPPADKIASNYADDPNVLVLSYHVDYWNYIGWKDPYSSERSTQRQRDYASAWNTRRIYTPQTIIQGQHDIVGSNGSKIKKQLAEENANGWVKVALTRKGNQLNYSLPASTVSNASIWLVTYDTQTGNSVPRGENRGRNLSHRNSVTHISNLSPWDGKALTNAIALPNDSDGVALLVQTSGHGKILGAGWL